MARLSGGILLLAAMLFAGPAWGQSNGVYRELYTGLSGNSLGQLTNDSSYPNGPSSFGIIATDFEMPRNVLDAYGQRCRALIVPPITGTYVFWIAATYSGALSLSTDESPFNRTQIAYQTASVCPRCWYNIPTQQSTNIFLQAGKRYYLEALQVALNGDDALAVGWKLADGTLEQSIPLARLIPFGMAATSPPFITSQPTNLTALENTAASFRCGVSNLDAVTYQWQRNGSNIAAGLGATYTIPLAGTNDSGVVFRCVISNSRGAITSSPVTLTVTADFSQPALFNAANLNSNTVQVTFTKPVEPVTATNISNYALSGGTITSAKFGPSTRVIHLTTLPLSLGSNYMLTVNNVRDQSSAHNVIAPGSQRTFTALFKGVYREFFTSLPGSSLADLTNSPTFPNNPSTADLITNVFATPASATNNYGQRLRARIIAPVTGNYTFWIASDDSSVLFLGTNDLPTSAQTIASVTRASQVAPQEWGVQANQKSAPVSLVAGQQYYIEVLMKEGIAIYSPPDHLAVRWQLPDGSVDEPISIANLVPYGLTSPTITAQPASIYVIEPSPATFSVAVANVDFVSYQWQQNGTNIPGATNAIYTDLAAQVSENGATLRCVLANILGMTISASATLNVDPDVTPPNILNAVNNGSNRVVVYFAEPVEAATALTAANYSIPGIVISAPVLGANNRSVTLTTTPLIVGSNYTITVNGVRDRAAAPNTIAPNSQFTFAVVDFFLQDIGTPSPASIVSVPNGLDMAAGNGSFAGTNDSFNFAYQQRLGDFDVKVRVARLDFADTWTVASLMVRSNLAASSPYAAACATPSLAGAFFEYRTSVIAPSTSVGTFPVNYPYTWLRLQRSGGSTFNGYASFDGQTWTKLGSVTMSMPPTVYLGFALCSSNPSQNTFAQFRDFGSAAGGTIGTVPTTTEPPGPSSRRTPLAITEIMYHPPSRADGKNLEFVEIYNSNPFFEDISGYRISGDVDYTFPAGTILQGGAFLVVARNPADVQAVYGIGNVIGPFKNHLSHKKGTLRLRNKADAVLLEVSYDTNPPWPLAPDGPGHSLVLARPSYGEGHAEAWAQSDVIGGSPGGVDAIRVEPVRNVMINEFLAHTDFPELDYIELYNHSTVSVDLSGCWLTDDATTNKFRIPNGTVIGATGLVYFTETTIGFSLSAAGEIFYFVNSNQTRVVDSVAFDGQENGVSTGRYPDGAPRFSRMAAKTPGAPNSSIRAKGIVINEIMKKPVTDDDNDQFVEIYNRGTNAINLTGWQFTSGIDFKFPTNTIIPTNGYLVIARDAAHLILNYTNLNTNNTLGNFDGKLAHSGDTVTLSMPDTIVSTNLSGVVTTNTIYIAMDEVTYGKGGKWGLWNDGGGSSLELIDPHGDGRLPSNWADSDDTAKSVWTTVSFTGNLDNGDPSSSKNNSLQLYLLDSGECLVDNVSVSIPSINSGLNLVNNGGFESSLTGWTLQGDHMNSRLENAGFTNSTHSLHVVAEGRGDPQANRIFTLLSQTYNVTNVPGTITANVKWLHGRPEILLRLRNNPLDLPALLTIPKNLGTPGARNSRYATNAGPAITEVIHSPTLPTNNQPVLVTARVHDPDGIASVQLTYRVDSASGSPISVTMRDDGTSGDAIAGDGVYTGTIPGQVNDALVAFYVQATDGFAPAVTRRFPIDAPTHECLVHFGDSQPFGSYGTYRLWLTQGSYNQWVSNPKLSNLGNPGTFVYGNARVIYNATHRFGGSPFHAPQLDTPDGTNCDYYVEVPTDDQFLNENSFTLQTPGNFGRDTTGQAEQTTYWMARQLGLPYLYRRSVNVFFNGLHRGTTVYEDTQQPGGDFDAEFVPDSENGELYKVQYAFEGDDDALGHSTTPASLRVFMTTNGVNYVKKAARYRETFTKRSVDGSPYNYTNLFNLVDQVNTTNIGDAYVAQIFPLLDVKEWMGIFALERMVNNTDLYGNQKQSGSDGGQNCYIYKPDGDSWKFFMWDIDFCFSALPTDEVFDFTDAPISNLCSQPLVRRMYWQALEDHANGPWNPANSFPLLDARYNAYLASGIPVGPPTAIKDFITVRRDYILQLISDVRVDFGLTSNGGNDFSNATTLVTLNGAAPISARRITINGIDYPLSWSNITNWSVRLALSGQTNQFTVRAYDANGALLANGTKTITVYFSGFVARAEDSLLIDEIMFQPFTTNADYVEIYNRSTNTTFDLYGYRLNGVDFNFSPGTILNPQGYCVVVKDATVFRSTYGTNIATMAGEFSGNLDPDGETLTLVRKSSNTNQPDTVINKVKYEAVAPWPASPAMTNSGVALQLIDVSQDNARVSNWDDASGWRFFSYTTHPAGATISLWLDATNDIYIDDLRFVFGSVPGAGSNYVRNGDFETNLTAAWTFTSSYQGNSALSGLFAKSGSNSLHFAPLAVGGSTKAMTQTITPTPSSSSNYTVSFWYKPANVTNAVNLTVRLGGSGAQQTIDVHSALKATPGVANSVANTVDPYPLLWVNEVQPNSTGTLLDNTGTSQPWIELYNSSTNTIQLGGLSLSQTYTNLSAWTFPSNSFISPGQFRVVFVDGRPQFSTGSVLHTSFRVDGTNGSIVLSRTNQILDYINYAGVQNSQSYGSYPDGQLFSRQMFYFPTPGASNNPAPVPVTINEWMASNTNTIRNPANANKFDDWFELYNFGPATVDISGYYFTQDFNNKTAWRIPNGVTIASHAFLLCWADDNQQGTNMMGNALHVNFKLSKNGDKIGLYSPEGLKVHNVTFGAQGENVSQGLFSDGNVAGVFNFMPSATPRTNNTLATNAYAPVLATPANRVVNEGAFITFANSATDADLPPQQLTYSLAGAPEGAQVTLSGVFSWQTAEINGPGVYPITVVVSDNSVPPRTDSKTFTVTVNESNSPPSIGVIPNQSTYAGTLVSLGIPVTDADFPAQTFTYEILAGPSGANIDVGGTFTWAPTVAQAPSTNVISVKATDSGSTALSATQSFTIFVNAGAACGGFKGDVSPRGAPNGTNSITDWVQIGRFAAGLATVSNACEFARADCAPKPCGGGGTNITITDWVQAGRYAAGLDVPVLMTDCPPPSGLAATPKWRAKNLEVPRVISVTNATIARGTTNCLSVVLDAQGNENGLGFSIHFDTNLLTLVSLPTRGADVASAPYFLANTNDLAQGLIGIAFLLQGDESLPAGQRILANLCFRAKAGSDTETSTLSFGDSPVTREVSDPEAGALPANFRDTDVTLVSDTYLFITELRRATNGTANLKLMGPAGVWQIQRSSDISSWQPMVTLTNTTGRLEYTDMTATNTVQRFYRAVKQ